MCGIAGLIGRSKNKDVSYQLLSRLFANCESRGRDAAGYYGTEINDGKVLFHKEPGKSSEFVKKDMWKSVAKVNFDLMIVHARGTSTGVGGASTNKNNHPFVTSDRSIGLIHNGRIPDSEYDVLKKQWEIFSRCDSEILLRILESGELYTHADLDELFPGLDTEIATRLIGIRDIWKLANKAHMAVAVAERIQQENERRLWLFHNKHRPLWLADMRSTIGQIFFVSTPEIWQNSVLQTPSIRRYLNNHIKLIEMPTEEIWMMSIDQNNGTVSDDSLLKFEVCSTGAYKEWKPDEKKKIELPKGDPVADVLTLLDEEEDVIKDVDKFRQTQQNKSTKPDDNSSSAASFADDVDPSQREEDDTDIIPFDNGSGSNAHNGNTNGHRTNGSKVNHSSTVHGAYGAAARSKPNGGGNGACMLGGRGVVIPDDDDDTVIEDDLRQSAMNQIEEKIKAIKSLLDEIDICVTNYGTEDSIAEHEYGELLYQLEQMEMDLQGSVKILERR